MMNDYPKKYKEFYSRFDFIDDSQSLDEFKKFKTRLYNLLGKFDDYFNNDDINKFCNIIGVPVKWEKISVRKLVGSIPKLTYKYESLNMRTQLIDAKNEKEYLKVLQTILWVLYERPENPNYDKIFNSILDAIGLSNVNFNLLKNNNELILAPRGEKEFDENLINKVLEFLDENSNSHFVNSLNFYRGGEKHDYIKSAESLRRSLEEFLRFKLKNTRGLESNTQELQVQLKHNSKDEGVRSIIFGVFSKLDKYFNENSKHNDGDIDEGEIEYLIYQTGVLMRYINSAFR